MASYDLEQDFDHKLRFTDVNNPTSATYHHNDQYIPRSKSMQSGVPSHSLSYDDDHTPYMKSSAAKSSSTGQSYSSYQPYTSATPAAYHSQQHSNDSTERDLHYQYQSPPHHQYSSINSNQHQSEDESSYTNNTLRSYDSFDNYATIDDRDVRTPSDNNTSDFVSSPDKRTAAMQQPQAGYNSTVYNSSSGSPRRMDRYDQGYGSSSYNSPSHVQQQPATNMSRFRQANTTSNSTNSENFEVRVTPLSPNTSGTSLKSSNYHNDPPSPYRGYTPQTYGSPERSNNTYQQQTPYSNQPNSTSRGSSGGPAEIPFQNYGSGSTKNNVMNNNNTSGPGSMDYGYRSPQEQQYPEAAESKLVYTGPAKTYGYAQSKAMTDKPSSPGANQSNISSPQYRDNSIPSISVSPPHSPSASQHFPPPPPASQHFPLPPPASQHDNSKVKEAEVNALTNLLMQNMQAAADPDFFGTCSTCGQAVIGDMNTCSALDQIFHVQCFMCASCGCQLKGRPFYAMEGRPYCEPCYINTLEKCSNCMEPITDRIVRATGKPYHSDCFVCVVCSKNLEGVPFTVDSASQIHCIEDFHRKFAPRCCVCELPIMPNPGEEEVVRIVALDRSFHKECYKCEDCGLVLSSEADGRGCYPLDEHILCKNCNAKRIQQLTTKMTTEL